MKNKGFQVFEHDIIKVTKTDGSASLYEVASHNGYSEEHDRWTSAEVTTGERFFTHKGNVEVIYSPRTLYKSISEIQNDCGDNMDRAGEYTSDKLGQVLDMIKY